MVQSHDLSSLLKPDADWETHCRIIETSELLFSPALHSFDRGVASGSNHANWINDATTYHDLFLNLAVIRHILINHTPIEAVNTSCYAIGEMIGKLINTSSLSTLNQSYDGAVKLYQQLLTQHHRRKKWAWLLYLLALVKREHFIKWYLPAIENTPLMQKQTFVQESQETEATPLPPRASLAALDATLQEALNINLHEETETVSVEQLSDPIKRQAIEIAKEILKKLKIQFAEMNIAQMMDTGRPDFSDTEQQINSVLAVYEYHLGQAANLDPTIYDDPLVQDANAAFNMLQAQTIMQALQDAMASGDAMQVAKLQKQLGQLNLRQWDGEQSAQELLEALEKGFEMILATIQYSRQSPSEDNQRALIMQGMLREHSLNQSTEERFSLSFDEAYQQMIQARRENAEKQQQQGIDVITKPGSRKQSVSTSQQKEPKNKSFDTLLSGKDMKQMQSSLNTKTSGNFDVSAPSSAKRIVATEVHKGKQRRHGDQQQQQQKRKEAKLAHHRNNQNQRQEDILPPPIDPKDKHKNRGR